MRVISKINPELLGILTEFSDFFFSRGTSHLDKAILEMAEKRDFLPQRDMYEEATSLEYLQNALKKTEDYGFPRHSWGFDIKGDGPYYDDDELKTESNKVNNKLMDFFGARNNALQMYYPSMGYIGWHHNANAKGYNIVLSCNPEGDGEFEHWDHINNKLNVMNDQPGWNCKVGYYGSFSEPDKIYWHCARTRTPRITLGYIIYDKNIWENMVDDIDAGS